MRAPPVDVARSSDRTFQVFNAVVSTGALAFLVWLMWIRRGGAGSGVDLRFLPAVNAGLNALAASLLVAGYVAIRRGERRLHQFLMVSAFACSTLFFACYVAYHWAHGDTRYTGTGLARTAYLTMLASHIALSIPLIPLSITTLWLSSTGRLSRHRRLAKITLPVWLYVSVTGVAIYFVLRGSAPAVP